MISRLYTLSAYYIREFASEDGKKARMRGAEERGREGGREGDGEGKWKEGWESRPE